MKHAFWTLLSFILFSFSVQAQNFTKRNDLLAERDMHSAVPVGIADMNGDGLDDLVTMSEGTDVFIQYQTPDPDRPFVRYSFPVGIPGQEQNDVCVADFNNDGFNDILTVGSYDRVKVLYAIPHTYEFNYTDFVVTPFFSQGASTGDFNGDGWVDAVLLNDNGLNYTLINDGTGTLVWEDFFDFVTVPASDNSGNYGSVYTDFDMDGDNDFYIAKCRQGVNDPTDPRRINALFVNDGTNNYIESAATYGLANGRQTWTADFGDMDNDGDMDCFMTQHDVICELFENINNDTFINVTQSAGLNIGGIPLQGMFRDFDNDGFQDILVSGDRVDYWRNNGDKTFTKHEPFDDIVFGTFSLGDLNHDGFTDVYASSVIPFNTPDLFRPDNLFITEPNDNHFLAIELMDTVVNPSAIGAMALLYGEWGIQIRDVRGGEQYGVSNGHKMIFGLGVQTTFDSLIIRWPDGERETYTQLSIDEHHTIRRGCATKALKEWSAVEVLCNNDSLVLKIENSNGLVHWSTGIVADSIIVKETGIYYALLDEIDECLVRTSPVEVIVDPDSVRPYIIYEGNEILCKGDLAVLSASIGNVFEWSSGDTVQTITVSETGDYVVVVEGYCSTLISDTLHLDFTTPELPVTAQDTFGVGEPALLTALGDSIVWYDESGENIIGTGPELILENLTESTTVYAQNITSLGRESFDLGPAQHVGETKYNGLTINGGLVFEVFNPVVLNSFTVFTDSAGARIIEILDGNDVIYSIQVDLIPGANLIELDVELPVGEFEVSTNADLNTENFGGVSPILWRTFDNLSYPYEVEDYITISTSTFGGNYYYYFYDWKVSTKERFCASDLVPVRAVSELEVSNDEISENEVIILSPNPTTGLSRLEIKGEGNYEIIVYNQAGIAVLKSKNISSQHSYSEIDLSSFASGTYVIQIVNDQRNFFRKLIKL